jgi:hypothetical protein
MAFCASWIAGARETDGASRDPDVSIKPAIGKDQMAQKFY